MTEKDTQELGVDKSDSAADAETPRDDRRQDDLARQEIRHLLEGGSPNSISPPNCGAWFEVIEALHEAYSKGGTEKVIQVFNSLAKTNGGLMHLVASGSQPSKTRWTMTELLQAEFPELPWAVPDLIPVGLTVLAGRPKVGKSWLALQIAVAVATGGRVLGRKVEKGKVLYLALEDSPRRLKDRLQKQVNCHER